MKIACKISAAGGFNLEQTLFCGQCFRFSEVSQNRFGGVALGRYIELESDTDNITVYCDSDFSEEEIRDLLDLNEDYGAINEILAADSTLKDAIKYAGGIRIMRQPMWETLCSFILSQNNNIKRIAGIIERLCENFGEPVGYGKYSFPSAEKIATLTVEDLAPIRSGFRAKYVIDAAKKVVAGEVDLEKVSILPIDEARDELMKISGVGPKVADCTLLFGFHKLSAFPKDVWVKRVLETYYPEGFPEFAKEYGGIAQQYLFHYIRTAENLNND